MENVDGAVEDCRTFLVLYTGVEGRHIILPKYIKKNYECYHSSWSLIV